MDQMQATRRKYPMVGGLADLLAAGTSPQRTQQMRGLMEFLQVPDIAQTLDRVSYGEPLTTGAGMTTKLRPEAESTLMAALGMTPMGKPAIMATKGLPVGMSIKDVGKVFPTSIASKSEVQNVANDFADQFRQMGFDVTLDHSGSKAGASSYLRVSDPQTGRFLSKPIRISDHSKGAKELDANINILNPQEDFAKITSALNDMRAKGDTLVFKQDKYAQELIANGIKPKTAYQRAKTEVAEVQAPQEAALLKKSDLTQVKRITPPHEVRDTEKLDSLVASMKKNGWQGRPILAFDVGNGLEALTGTHRLAAAKQAGIENVPVLKISDDIGNYADEYGRSIKDISDEEDVLEYLKNFGDKDAFELMRAERLNEQPINSLLQTLGR
jgi:hypothetical protein